MTTIPPWIESNHGKGNKCCDMIRLKIQQWQRKGRYVYYCLDVVTVLINTKWSHGACHTVLIRMLCFPKFYDATSFYAYFICILYFHSIVLSCNPFDNFYFLRYPKLLFSCHFSKVCEYKSLITAMFLCKKSKCLAKNPSWVALPFWINLDK